MARSAAWGVSGPLSALLGWLRAVALGRSRPRPRVAPQAAHPRSRTCRHDEAVLMDPAVIGPVVATQDRVAAVRGADASAGLGVETIFRGRKPEVAHHRSELVRVGTEARPASFQSVGPILFHAGGRQNRTSRGRNPPRLPALHASDHRRSGTLAFARAPTLMRLTHGERSDCSPDEQRIGPSNPSHHSSVGGCPVAKRSVQKSERLTAIDDAGLPSANPCDRRRSRLFLPS